MPDNLPFTRPAEGIQFLMPLSAARPASAEEGGGVWLHVMPIGTWKAPWQFMGAEIYEITAENIAAFVANFDAGIPGVDIALDENHRSGPAPGWIKQLRADADGLWARVEWTPLGEELIEKKLFRYGSPSWYDAAIMPYQDSVTGEKIPWVLEGFALTNKPFFTELPAVASRQEDGSLVYTTTPAADPTDAPGAAGPRTIPLRGDTNMPEPLPQPDPPAAPPAGDSVETLRAERDRLLAEKAKLEAQAAEAKRATDLAALRTRFAAVEAGGARLAEAHATRLAEAAMQIADPAARETHVLATIDAMTSGMVPQGELGGTSVPRSGDVNPNLFAAAQRLHIQPVHVHMAAVRGAGGIIDIEAAREAVARMGPLTASTEFPSLAYEDTMTLVRSMFLAGWEGAESLISRFANEVTDSARTISYNALGAPPRMREWLDEIQGAVLNTLGPYSQEVRDWEATLEIPLSEFKADKLGQYGMRIGQMGAYAKRHPDTLLLLLIASANATYCYDGQFLCDTDHEDPASGTQSNKLTTGYDDDEIADMVLALDANVAAMQKFLDDRGEPLDIGWEDSAVYDILCRPEARATFNQLATATEISGTSNGWKGRLRIHSSARFTTADQFWFCYLNAPTKPFIVQYQTGGEPSALKELGPDSEHCKKNGNIWISTQGHYTVVPGDWRYIIENNKS